MPSYSITFKPSVEKDLRRLPGPVITRVMDRIDGLRDDPLGRAAVKLSGAERLYRIRVGDYRVIYEVETGARQVTIHYIRHRREAYRDL